MIIILNYILERKKVCKNGLEVEIIDWFDCHHVLMRFEDNEEVIKPYNAFISGCVKHPSIKCLKMNTGLRTDRVGESIITHEGLKATITEYFGSDNITIELEDGTVYKNCTYRSFEDGALYYGYSRYIGEERVMNCGQVAKIVAIRSKEDIDVEIEGVILNTTYYNFVRGWCNTLLRNKNRADLRKNEVRVMNNGLSAKVIVYRNCHDIDVEFEDGTIITNKCYKDFKEGLIRHPLIRFNGNINPLVLSQKERYIGTRNYMNSGLEAEIVDYRSFDDITVRFSDGYEIKTKMGYFNKGSIMHKTLKLIRTNTITRNSTFNGFEIYSLDYKLHDNKDTYYTCKCSKCGYKDILSPSQMLEHKCQEVS